jgi:hypothetical protein
LAKKPRTPPPPRVQAPQRRDGRGSTERRTRLFLYAAAAAGPIVLVVVLAVIFLGGNGDDSVPSSKQFVASGCTLKKYALLEGIHVTTEDAKVKWNSWPPTSGPHYAAPAPFNFYEEAINPRITLHNLEHGGIDIFYGSGVPSSQIEQVRSFWRDDPNAILVAPMPKPDKNLTIPRPLPNYTNKIVAAAWTAPAYSGSSRKSSKGNGFLLTCSRFDEKTFKAFRDIHRGKGPERFPVSALTPGS